MSLNESFNFVYDTKFSNEPIKNFNSLEFMKKKKNRNCPFSMDNKRIVTVQFNLDRAGWMEICATV